MFKPFKKSYSLEELNLFRFLTKCKLFETLENAELHALVPSLFLRNYLQDEAIFFRNDPSQALYIVKTGKIELSLNIGIRSEKLNLVDANAAFGVNCLLPNTKRTYNAVVQSDTADLYVIPQINLQDIFKKQPEIHAKMLTSLCDTYNRYTTGVFKNYKRSFGFFELGEIPVDF